VKQRFNAKFAKVAKTGFDFAFFASSAFFRFKAAR